MVEGHSIRRAVAILRDPVWAAVVVLVILLGVYLAIPYDAAPGSSLIRFELVLYTIPQLLMMGALGAATLRTRPPERTFWLLLAGAALFIVVYEMPWSIEVWNGRPPPASETLASTAMLLVPATIFAAFLVSMNRSSDPFSLRRIRFVVDGLAVLTVVFIGLYSLFVRPYFESFGLLDSLQHLRGTLHSTIGAGVVLGIAANVRNLRASGWRPWERFAVAGIGVYGFALSLIPIYSVGLRVGPNYSNQIIEAMLMTGPYLLFVAGLSRLAAEPEQSALIRYEPPFTRTNVLSVGFQVAMLGGIAVFVIAAVRSADGSLDRLLYLGAAVAVCVLLAVRSAIDAVDTGTFFNRSITDPVSGARTHRFFRERLHDEVELGRRCADPLAVVAGSLDGFRAYDTSPDDSAGNRLLRETVGAMVPLVGAADTLARIDDDTFALMLVGASRGWAIEVAEGIRRAVRESTGTTLSAGVALFPEHGVVPSELLARAKRALMWSRTHGADRLAVYDPEIMRIAEGEDVLLGLEQQTSASAIKALAAAVDARDADTRFHSQGVADLAILFGHRLGLDLELIRRLESAALMHDVGKIGVSDRVLRKRGPLNVYERAEVREHPVLGERILSASTLSELCPWVRSHHERWDGAGYPDGRARDEIPFESRILALCDAYDAMTSPRSYRSRLSTAAALQEIDLCMGTQFDPELAEEFIVLVRDHVDPEPRYN